MGYRFQSLCPIAYFLILSLSSWVFQCSAALQNTHGSQLNNNGCDLFTGSWVHDDTYPLYDTTQCPFIATGFNCKKNGRQDTDYLKYRWKPTACELPRFDGNDFLKRYKGKKILFVGDSITNNQWQSLTCLLHVTVPNSKYTVSAHQFYLPEYEIHVDRVVHQFLVDLVPEKMGTVLKLDSIEKNGEEFRGYDILIFDSWHWWQRNDTSKRWDYIQDGDQIVKDMDRLVAYKMALTTWSKWIESNVDPKVTKVFFQGITPTHFSGKSWNNTDPGVNCKGQTEPISGSTYPSEGRLPEAVAILDGVLASMSKPVALLNVTTLSQFRKDGHPSIYSGNKDRSDCIHWCLSGVPDTWNQLLYAMLVTSGN